MSEIFEKSSEQFYTIPTWNELDSSLKVGFTTKNGGVSEREFSSLNIGFHVNDVQKHVVQNKSILAEEIQFPLDAWVAAEQTHMTNIVHVTTSHKGMGATDYESSIKDTDGLFTNHNGVLLTLCYADCVPIYYYSPKNHFIGIVHAGWKGTVAGIAAEMVLKWKEFGIKAEEIITVIGPSICHNCYVVDDKVIEQVNKIVEDDCEKPYNLISNGQYSLDLKKLNRFILMKAGVQDVAVTNLCTSCQHTEFYSHRRDAGKTGRLMSFIGWKEETL